MTVSAIDWFANQTLNNFLLISFHTNLIFQCDILIDDEEDQDGFSSIGEISVFFKDDFLKLRLTATHYMVWLLAEPTIAVFLHSDSNVFQFGVVLSTNLASDAGSVEECWRLP